MAGTKPRKRHQSAGAHTNHLVSVGLIRWDLPTSINTNIRCALSSKLDEMTALSYKEQADIVCITETCCMPDKGPMTTLELPGYTSVGRDRKDGPGGGGFIAYIRDSIPFHHWKELDGPQSRDLETIWLTIRPRTLPRGVSNILLGLLYHPPDAKDGPMLNHIVKCMDHTLAKHPDSGIIIGGDTN